MCPIYCQHSAKVMMPRDAPEKFLICVIRVIRGYSSCVIRLLTLQGDSEAVIDYGRKLCYLG